MAFVCCSVSGHGHGLASHKFMVWFYIESRSPVFVFEMIPLTRSEKKARTQVNPMGAWFRLSHSHICTFIMERKQNGLRC